MERHNVYDFVNNVFAYNTAMSPSRNKAMLELCHMNAYTKPSFAGDTNVIDGTRTSATVFTPTVSESWTVDALIGTYCISMVDTAETVWAWHQIADNDATSLTISTTYGDDALLTSADQIILYASMAAAQAAFATVKV